MKQCHSFTESLVLERTKFFMKKNAFYEHAIGLELCFNVLMNILKFSMLISNTVSINSYNPHE